MTVTPTPNAFGIRVDTPVVAFFSEEMDEKTITTGEGGTFNIYDRGNRIVPGQIRFELINGKTVAIWQAAESMQYRLAFDTKYTVILTKDIRDKDGNSIFNEWNSWFTTTATGMFDTTPPTVSLSIEPPVNPNFVLPGQLIKIHAYASDQGSGVGRLEARIKNMDVQGSLFELFDQKSVFANDKPPFIFTIDSAKLSLGNTYQVMVTAYDVVGNAQNATISLIMGTSADPPTIQLPEDPTQPVLHGISVDVTPVQFTGGITQVRYYLNGQLYRTVTLPPYQASIRTLGLPLGQHTVQAIAIDGLGQLGEDSMTFTLIENRNMPTVNFSGMTSGVQVVSGENILIKGNAVDPVGISSLKYYLDSPTGNPIFTGLAPILLNTTGLSLGEHTIYLQATNLLGISNDLNDPASALTFIVVQPPPGVPPDAPSITSVSYPVNNVVTIQGTSVPGAKIVISNEKLGHQVNYQANQAGNFSGQIEASVGDILTIVAYDLSKSPDPSQATQVTVPAPPLVTGIIVSPVNLYFTAANLYHDILVTATYNDGTSKNVTSKASFSSNNPACASVNSSGRVVAIAHGNATITVSFEGYQAQIPVTCYIVSLVNITVEPQTINFISIGQTQQLTVTGHYSDGTSQTITSELVYTTGNPTIATVNSSGLVSAKGEGNTQINVSKSGVPPVTVSVTVSTAQDPPPTVAILNPANGTQVERQQAISVLVRAQDTIGGVTRIYLEVTGQTIYSDMKQVSPALDVTREFNFNVSPSASIGGSITVTVRAEDTSGKISDPVSINLEVVDKTAPLVVITQPANNTPFNYGDTVNITVSSSDAVGVTQVRYQTTGALTYSGTQNFPMGTLTATANFSFNIPYGVPNPNVQIIAYARDAAGNERASAPVNIILTDADITPPETEIISVANPGSNAFTTVTYQVTSGLDDLDYVLLYFRRNGIGTFNRYTDADGGNPEGKYFPQSGNTGTIVFNSTKMGGDGTYEFYTVGVDKAGNIEPAPKDGSGNILPDETMTFNAGTIWTVINTPTVINEGDTTFDDKNLRIIGTAVTINGYHRFKNMELLNGAVLTHPETTMTSEYGINLELWTLTVDSSSSINVDGRGYLGGMREGNDCTGQTQGNTNGSTYRSGGSYGGLGGAYDGTPNPVYGNFVMPFDL
ncbi:MAG: Ig-like domain-containing protein, partial [Candidatus Methanomethylicaceae archaeon]